MQTIFNRNFLPIFTRASLLPLTLRLPSLSRTIRDNDATETQVSGGLSLDTCNNPKGSAGSDQRRWLFMFLSRAFDPHLTWVAQFSSFRLSSFLKYSPTSRTIGASSAFPPAKDGVEWR